MYQPGECIVFLQKYGSRYLSLARIFLTKFSNSFYRLGVSTVNLPQRFGFIIVRYAYASVLGLTSTASPGAAH